MAEWVKRLRSRQYIKHVQGQPCLYCGSPGEAHHLTHAQPRALGLKNGDQFIVPLCHPHHMALHDSPMPERTWWALIGIDPMIWAEISFSEWEQANVNITTDIVSARLRHGRRLYS